MSKGKENKSINTILQGCYECGVQDEELQKEGYESVRELTVDLQGNGYPIEPEKQ